MTTTVKIEVTYAHFTPKVRILDDKGNPTNDPEITLNVGEPVEVTIWDTKKFEVYEEGPK